MPRYEIQSFHNGEWTNDTALLGGGLDQVANLFELEAQAQAVMAELQRLWPEASLRVAAVED